MSLNKQSAAQLRQLLQDPSKDLPLEQEKAPIVVVPAVNPRGQLNDYSDVASSVKRKRKNNPEKDEQVDLATLVRREKLDSYETGADPDKAFAKQILRNKQYKDNVEYLDEEAENMASMRLPTLQTKKAVAVNDYKRQKTALDKCWYCYRNEGQTLPEAPLVSLAYRVYLALPVTTELTPGHCLIVPVEHCSSVLELDDDTWDEIRNFQKCLIQMFAQDGKSCLFMETVTNLNNHLHSFIECIPVPDKVFDTAPGYFKEALLSADEEWSQHKKILDTRVKGFRRVMSPRVPYFHVWFNLDGGFGHVIENTQLFPFYFGKEVIGGMLQLDSYTWRKPKRLGSEQLRVSSFRVKWKEWDWTASLA